MRNPTADSEFTSVPNYPVWEDPPEDVQGASPCRGVCAVGK